MLLRKSILAIFFTLFSVAVLSNDVEDKKNQEVNRYIHQLAESSDTELYDLVNVIRFSGLSDKRLFDKVEELLNVKHQAFLSLDNDDDVKISQIKILIMALASAGNATYQVTLNSVLNESDNRSIRNRAKQSTKNIGFYNTRNNIMQNYDSLIEGQSLQTRRTLNLLQSSDRKLSRYAAEDIHRIGNTDPLVLEWIATQLDSQVHQVEDKIHIDMLAWYCKALAKVNREQYAPLLNKLIKDKSIPSKIRKHAKKALRNN